MRYAVFTAVILLNVVVVACLALPAFDQWAGHAVVVLVLEAVLLPTVGVPLLVHHLRRGLGFREALAASLSTIMDFLSGWA